MIQSSAQAVKVIAGGRNDSTKWVAGRFENTDNVSTKADKM